ncbi:MAG: Rieske (2Fe-2S) protein [Pedobacter sp.]|nr:MAG: Rieske (2Fe-2S) protein [Pedobacter sp.]
MIWVKVLSKQELDRGEFIETVKADGRKICLIKNQVGYFAIQHSCPHAGGVLSSGWCKNGNIICPIHRYEYSLTTGRGAKGQGDYIDIYPTEIREDGLYVGMKQNWFKRIFS